MKNRIDIKDLFGGLQNQMVAQLNTNREFILHPGSKGDSLENVWIEWLKKYLPNRYCVDKAIIIDSKGDLSNQIDLVIYDQQYQLKVFMPFLRLSLILEVTLMVIVLLNIRESKLKVLES